MAAAVATPLVGDLQDPEYVNWLKANRALHRTIDLLRNVCLAEMQTFQQLLLGKHGSTTCSKPCTHSDIITTHGRWRGWSIACPSTPNVCSQWLVDIVREKLRQSTRLYWENSDFSQWQTQPWQIAKIFMESQDRACIRPADTDAAGILQLLMNCKLFKNMMTWAKLDAVRPCWYYYNVCVRVVCVLYEIVTN